MKAETYSYRYAEEILQHRNYIAAWEEIMGVVLSAPVFKFPNKSAKNRKLDVVQQVMNTYFDRLFAVNLGWEYHPLATRIEASGLLADFRKTFNGNLAIQAEVQFGNMSRWYSDIFKLQAAYSEGLIQMGLSIVPTLSLATRIDSNIVNYERVVRELPSAELSITLPILVVGVSSNPEVEEVDISVCQFSGIKEITGKNKASSRWAIVNGYLNKAPMDQISAESETGPMEYLDTAAINAEEELDSSE
jgi:hypothetical protein